MLQHLLEPVREFWASRRRRRQIQQSYRRGVSPFLIEPLEPRVLLSGDLLLHPEATTVSQEPAVPVIVFAQDTQPATNVELNVEDVPAWTFADVSEAGARPEIRRLPATEPGVSISEIELTRSDSHTNIVDQLAETLKIANGPPANQASTITPTISWIADSNGFWDVATNWRDANGVSRVPTASDDVLIDRGAANPVITVRISGQVAHSLLSNEALTVSAGSLTLGADSEINAAVILNSTFSITGTLQLSKNITLSGGTIQGGTVAFTSAAKLIGTTAHGFLNGVTLKGETGQTQPVVMEIFGNDTSVSITGNLTLDNATINMQSLGRLDFTSATATLGGTGSVGFLNDDSRTIVRSTANGGQLTIGAGVTIRGSGGTVGYSLNWWGGPTDITVINQGTIGPTQPGTIYLSAANATNNGTTQSTDGGSLVIQATTWTNSSAAQIVTAGNSAVTLNGAWTNSGTSQPTPPLTLEGP